MAKVVFTKDGVDLSDKAEIKPSHYDWAEEKAQLLAPPGMSYVAEVTDSFAKLGVAMADLAQEAVAKAEPAFLALGHELKKKSTTWMIVSEHLPPSKAFEGEMYDIMKVGGLSVRRKGNRFYFQAATFSRHVSLKYGTIMDTHYIPSYKDFNIEVPDLTSDWVLSITEIKK